MVMNLIPVLLSNNSRNSKETTGTQTKYLIQVLIDKIEVIRYCMLSYLKLYFFADPTPTETVAH